MIAYAPCLSQFLRDSREKWKGEFPLPKLRQLENSCHDLLTWKLLVTDGSSVVVVDAAQDSRTKFRIALQGHSNETAASRVSAR